MNNIVDDNVSLIVECGGVPALVRHLQAPQCKELEHQVESVSAFTLGLLTKHVIYTSFHVYGYKFYFISLTHSYY